MLESILNIYYVELLQIQIIIKQLVMYDVKMRQYAALYNLIHKTSSLVFHTS